MVPPKVQSLILGVLLTACMSVQAEPALTHEGENARFWVHGRLSPYNGTPSFRIWIVGTERILGVTDSLDTGQENPSMPQALLDVFLAQPDVFGTAIYADFYVEPLRADLKGTMRPIRIVNAKKLVVTYADRIVVMKDRL